jgi:hypothetical protein
MPDSLITNPNAAFNESSLIGVRYIVVQNTNGSAHGTITAQFAAIYDTAFNPPAKQITGALTGSNGQLFAGIAMDTIIAGGTGRIATYGTIQAICGVAATIGDTLILDGTTAGAVTNSGGTPVVGTTVGVALQTGTAYVAPGTPFWMIVNKA